MHRLAYKGIARPHQCVATMAWGGVCVKKTAACDGGLAQADHMLLSMFAAVHGKGTTCCTGGATTQVVIDDSALRQSYDMHGKSRAGGRADKEQA